MRGLEGGGRGEARSAWGEEADHNVSWRRLNLFVRGLGGGCDAAGRNDCTHHPRPPKPTRLSGLPRGFLLASGASHGGSATRVPVLTP